MSKEINIDIFIHDYFEMQKDNNPKVDRSIEFKKETRYITEDGLLQAIKRTKCLQYLLVNFSSYTEKEISILCEYYFLSDGVSWRIEIHRKEALEILKIASNIRADKLLKENKKKIDDEYYRWYTSHSKKCSAQESMDFSHHFGHAKDICEQIAFAVLYNPYEDLDKDINWNWAKTKKLLIQQKKKKTKK